MLNVCQICTYTFIVIIFLVLRPFIMFTLTMVFDPGGLNQCHDCDSESLMDSILPLRIHQIYYNINNVDLSPELKQAQQSWLILNKQFNYTLWNETMVEELLYGEYPYLKDLYYSYDRWIHKIDVAKYIILHQYGGIYADLDIECIIDMFEAYRSLPVDTGVVMYYTKPFGVATDFLIAKPKHPFMTSVIRGLKSAHRWYVLPFFTVMLSSGPTYLTARFWSFSTRYDMIVLEDTRAYIVHRTGGSWHEADTNIIWWMFLNAELLFQWTFTCVAVIVFLCIGFKLFRRRLRTQTFIH